MAADNEMTSSKLTETMPDWTYQTVFKPALFRLGPELGRRFAFRNMGRLANLPLGKTVIRLMGHMSPDRRLTVEHDGFRFPSPVGVGCRLDSRMEATAALAQFGFGFLEVGPVRRERDDRADVITFDVAQESMVYETVNRCLSVSEVTNTIRRSASFQQPVLARLSGNDISELRHLMSQLMPEVDGFVVDAAQTDSAIRILQQSGTEPRLLFGCVTPEEMSDQATRERLRESSQSHRAFGVVIDASRALQPPVIGKPLKQPTLDSVRECRDALGADIFIIAATGIHSPADALDAIEAGADMVQVDSGMAFHGPGLAKRINEAVLYRFQKLHPDQQIQVRPRLGSMSWFWALLMGFSMFFGGLLALAIAWTRVVLPYDERFAGLTRTDLMAINEKLLEFMKHDRVTLAGTMLAVGVLYVTMSWYGIRRGMHWAQVSIITSAMAGFLSFFSFLGFGYFDPFHAFVTTILFQFLLLAFHSDMRTDRVITMPGLHNNRPWRQCQWGQLLYILHGAILIVAGLVISAIGMTDVFVKEDLEFMNTTAAELCGDNPQLLPLVAHDRATFGGMLIACGFATLLPALWGFQRGHSWLWWALLTGGTLAYGAALFVHLEVGYDSLKHLLPAYFGIGGLWFSAWLSHSYLVERDEALEGEWNDRIQRANGCP